ncbi:MAG: diacylglycerol/lipid kinase family protein [Candidatus Longimicrobiales bacterium M2_2A_002]
MSPRALIVLNPAAGGCTARSRFAAIRPELDARFPHRVVELGTGGAWKRALHGALDRGARLVIAAGGDGTVHAVANALLEAGVPRDVVLGAIGLGSSNDFHKPVRERIAGVPVRLDAAGAAPRDVVIAHWTRADAGRSEAVLVSASVGIVARANAFFNDGDWLLTRLKRWWMAGAITYAALNIIARRPRLATRIDHPTGRWAGAVASLSVLETPHLSGSLRYDLPARPDDGAVTVAVIESSGRLMLLARLIGLQLGRFRDRRRTRHWIVPEVVVELGEPGPLELDGEVRTAERVRFEVLKERLLACP